MVSATISRQITTISSVIRSASDKIAYPIQLLDQDCRYLLGCGPMWSGSIFPSDLPLKILRERLVPANDTSDVRKILMGLSGRSL